MSEEGRCKTVKACLEPERSVHKGEFAGSFALHGQKAQADFKALGSSTNEGCQTSESELRAESSMPSVPSAKMASWKQCWTHAKGKRVSLLSSSNVQYVPRAQRTSCQGSAFKLHARTILPGL